MNYEGRGRYRHYKGAEYEVIGLALQEDTVVKPVEEGEVLACPVCGNVVRNTCYHDGEDISSRPMLASEAAALRDEEEVTFVIYRPLTPGSMLEGRDEDLWARELADFNQAVVVESDTPGGSLVPRFTRIA